MMPKRISKVTAGSLVAAWVYREFDAIKKRDPEQYGSHRTVLKQTQA